MNHIMNSVTCLSRITHGSLDLLLRQAIVSRYTTWQSEKKSKDISPRRKKRETSVRLTFV